jgi:hypothetical protein
MKLQVSLLSCGKCGKPRGRFHLCQGTRSGRDRLRVTALFACGKCKKTVRNPFTHTCTVRTDWAKRRRRQERRRKVAAQRQRRRERTEGARERRRKHAADAATRRKAAAARRRAEARARARGRKPRAPAHNPRNCQEEGCTRYPCRLYQDGYDDGLTAALAGRDDR